MLDVAGDPHRQTGRGGKVRYPDVAHEAYLELVPGHCPFLDEPRECPQGRGRVAQVVQRADVSQHEAIGRRPSGAGGEVVFVHAVHDLDAAAIVARDALDREVPGRHDDA